MKVVDKRSAAPEGNRLPDSYTLYRQDGSILILRKQNLTEMERWIVDLLEGNCTISMLFNCAEEHKEEKPN